MDRLENLLTRLWLDIFGDTCSNPRGVVGRLCAPYPVGEASRSLPGGCDREAFQICSFMITNFPIWRRSLFQQIGIGCSIRSCPKVCLQGSEGRFVKCSWSLLWASLTPNMAIIFDARNYLVTGTKTRGHFWGLSAVFVGPIFWWFSGKAKNTAVSEGVRSSVRSLTEGPNFA